MAPAHSGSCTRRPALGALLATATSGWTARIHRHGMAVVWAAMGWGRCDDGLGFAPNLGLALAMLALAGGSDMVSGIFRGRSGTRRSRTTCAAASPGSSR